MKSNSSILIKQMPPELCIDIINKTLELLEYDYIDKFTETTVILNSMLSLIIMPYETNKKSGGRVYEGKINDIFGGIDIKYDCFAPLKFDKKGVYVGNKTIKTFVNKLRNGLAHQNINTSVDENGNTVFTIYNIFGCTRKFELSNEVKDKVIINKSNIIDFMITVSPSALKSIAEYIAKSYTNYYMKEK